MDFTAEEKALWEKTVKGVQENCKKVDDFLKSKN